jgi:DNA-binding NarL/FixJ family response regulator
MRIFIADDHEIFRRGLKSLLESRPGWKICGEAADGLEAVRQAFELEPDVLVLDVSMPGLNGLDVTRRILAQRPDLRVVILSQHEPSFLETSALDAGAKVYLTKTDVGQKLIRAIEGLDSESARPSH